MSVKKLTLMLFILFSSTAIAMAGSGHMKNLVETAAGNDAFKTLVAAVKAAGLVETLAGKGPFTVFAPTNEAFAKLPEGTVESLLKPENKDKLISVLTYHVVPGKVMSKDIKPSQMVKTVNGQQVSIKLSYGKVSIDGANVTAADVEAENGVIHVIDTVILPKSGPLLHLFFELSLALPGSVIASEKLVCVGYLKIANTNFPTCLKHNLKN